MELSVVIVNYNVKHFLEQCLLSVLKASEGMDAEVWVVDNASVDGSVAMVREKFPWVKLIASAENLGFSKGNNLAIRQASGKYILLLNPDTVVEPDTFKKCIDFMDFHPDAGGLGVYMMDGKGNFLPESKRSLPTPSVAFYKIFGLSALFPTSKVFGRYHLGYLSKEKTHKVQVLSGAFMFLRAETLQKVGLLDEDFFMYGEDVDLSYRIELGGYANYYFPETRIIHYKGESTKKGSINYVFVFYRAMVQFAEKHFAGNNARFLSLLINTAIWLRAFMAILYRGIKSVYRQAIDFLVLYLGVYVISFYWQHEIKSNIDYPPEFYRFSIPFYIITWIISVYLSGGYDKPVNLMRVVRGVLAGTATILIAYSLLSEEYRFSRAIILLSSIWAVFSLLSLRGLFSYLGFNDYRLDTAQSKRIVIVGYPEECQRVEQLIIKSGVPVEIIGFVSPQSLPSTHSSYLGTIENLEQMASVFKLNEIIFCGNDLESNIIIRSMADLATLDVEFKIAPAETGFIIGSNSIDTPGDWYSVDINSFAKPHNKRKKRFFDLLISLCLLPFLPVLFISEKRKPLALHWLDVVVGKKTWVGITRQQGSKQLPPGVLHPSEIAGTNTIDPPTRRRLELLYLKNYTIWTDFQILWRRLY